MARRSKSKSIYYIALTRLTNTETGKIFMPGDAVYPDDFNVNVINTWVKQGDLVPADEYDEDEEVMEDGGY